MPTVTAVLVYAIQATWDIDFPMGNIIRHLSPYIPLCFVEQSPDTPMYLTLELRIMGGSNLHMAPQARNQLIASIEVLTVPT